MVKPLMPAFLSAIASAMPPNPQPMIRIGTEVTEAELGSAVPTTWTFIAVLAPERPGYCRRASKRLVVRLDPRQSSLCPHTAPSSEKEPPMTRVAVTTPYFDFFPQLKAEFEALYPGSKFRIDRTPLTEDALIDYLKGYEAAVIGLDRFTDKVCANLPDLKVVSLCSAGADHIDPA